MDSEESDVVYDSMQKNARRVSRRGVRWAVRTSGNSVMNSWRLVPTKRPHGVFNILDRKEEQIANGDGPYRYHYGLSYAGVGGGRGRRNGVNANEQPNFNRAGPSSTVVRSIDKDKNWEMIEDAKKAQAQRRQLTTSYSDTDDISASDSSSDDEKGPLDTVPQVAVLETRQGFDWDDNKKARYWASQRLGDAFVNRTLKNEPLKTETNEDDDEQIAQRFKISKGRKGFVVRDRRPKGKKGVKKPSHHNSRPEEIYDLARADVLIVSSPGPKLDKWALTHTNTSGCQCPSCKPRSDRGTRSYRQRKMLEEL